MSMNAEPHGTECCGAGSISEWWKDMNEQHIINAELEAHEINERDFNYEDTDIPPELGEYMVECIFTDDQLAQSESKLAKILKKRGYKRVARWVNPNTDNACNHFVKFNRTSRKIPYEW